MVEAGDGAGGATGGAGGGTGTVAFFKGLHKPLTQAP